MNRETKENFIELLASKVGYKFKNENLAAEALTHRSHFNEHPSAPGHNERLEFLGDAVLDLIIADELMRLMPDAHEGELTKYRASLVNEQSLAAIARRLDLGSALRLGNGEEKNNGREKSSILSNVVESVAGAIYLDGGLEAVKETSAAWFAELMVHVNEGRLIEDPKTALQEHLQATGRAAPQYHVVKESGPDHLKIFEVEVRSSGNVLAKGSGRSKKEAEKTAAKIAWSQIDEKES